jgi:hypothetical protein
MMIWSMRDLRQRGNNTAACLVLRDEDEPVRLTDQVGPHATLQALRPAQHAACRLSHGHDVTRHTTRNVLTSDQLIVTTEKLVIDL